MPALIFSSSVLSKSSGLSRWPRTLEPPLALCLICLHPSSIDWEEQSRKARLETLPVLSTEQSLPLICQLHSCKSSNSYSTHSKLFRAQCWVSLNLCIRTAAISAKVLCSQSFAASLVFSTQCARLHLSLLNTLSSMLVHPSRLQVPLKVSPTLSPPYKTFTLMHPKAK